MHERRTMLLASKQFPANLSNLLIYFDVGRQSYIQDACLCATHDCQNRGFQKFPMNNSGHERRTAACVQRPGGRAARDRHWHRASSASTPSPRACGEFQACGAQFSFENKYMPFEDAVNHELHVATLSTLPSNIKQGETHDECFPLHLDQDLKY